MARIILLPLPHLTPGDNETVPVSVNGVTTQVPYNRPVDVPSEALEALRGAGRSFAELDAPTEEPTEEPSA